jgi:uncharacterized RDD family membrane protein YckC
MNHTQPLPDPDRHAEFYAGTVTKRAFAWLIDSLIILAICLFILPFTIFTALFFWPVFYITIGFFYRWATMSGGSATWGMRMMAVGFLDRNGRRFDAGTAFVHCAIYSLCLLSFVPQLLSIGSMLMTERGQSLPDLVLGAVCINRAANT